MYTGKKNQGVVKEVGRRKNLREDAVNMLSLLQMFSSLLQCHMFNQEGEINPVKIKLTREEKKQHRW